MPKGLSGKERQLLTIRHEIPDRISTDCSRIGILNELAAFLKIDQAAVHESLGLDGVVVKPTYTGELLSPVDGITWTQWGTPDSKDYGSMRRYPLSGDATVRDIEKFPWPDASKYNYDETRDEIRALGREYAVRGPDWFPLFCRVCDLFGMEETMVLILTRPQVFEAALECIFDHNAEVCRRYVECGGDELAILYVGDDFATQRGMMISPELWRRTLRPLYAKVFEIGKSAGKFVWFHSCGDVTPVLGDLIDIGVDVWETVQLHTLPISPEELKRTYGRHLTFFGGINTQRLPFAKPTEVRQEVCRIIEALGRQGGLICGPDHHLESDVPLENIFALFQAARAFRGSGYTAGWSGHPPGGPESRSNEAPH